MQNLHSRHFQQCALSAADCAHGGVAVAVDRDVEDGAVGGVVADCAGIGVAHEDDYAADDECVGDWRLRQMFPHFSVYHL